MVQVIKKMKLFGPFGNLENISLKTLQELKEAKEILMRQKHPNHLDILYYRQLGKQLKELRTLILIKRNVELNMLDVFYLFFPLKNIFLN